jgi:hypothetical protein
MHAAMHMPGATMHVPLVGVRNYAGETIVGIHDTRRGRGVGWGCIRYHVGNAICSGSTGIISLLLPQVLTSLMMMVPMLPKRSFSVGRISAE